jgi:hypothetical protein
VDDLSVGGLPVEAERGELREELGVGEGVEGDTAVRAFELS